RVGEHSGVDEATRGPVGNPGVEAREVRHAVCSPPPAMVAEAVALRSARPYQPPRGSRKAFLHFVTIGDRAAAAPE
ncbi:MAG TPA: hypothetical protein VD836_18225, partial [Solirubrobacteraceae bacterium]|nr:hypothetical protein [Solirubrobacteraceae bacterium]